MFKCKYKYKLNFVSNENIFKILQSIADYDKADGRVELSPHSLFRTSRKCESHSQAGSATAEQEAEFVKSQWKIHLIKRANVNMNANLC